MFLLWMRDGGHLNAAPAGLALRCRPWCHRTKAATAEVIHSLQNLLLAIHDEGAVSHNGLINGFTTDQQDNGVIIGFHAELAACPIQHDQLPFTSHALTIDQYGALQHHQGGCPAFRAFQLGNTP